MNVSLGFSQYKDPILAANEAIGQAIIGLKNTAPSLAFIFSSIEYAHPVVIKASNNLLGEIPIFGCSSLGILTSFGVFKHGFAVLLVSLGEHTFFNVAAVREIAKKTPLSAGKELGDKLLFGFKNVPRSLSVIISDKLVTEGTQLIQGLQESLGNSFPLVGASAASENFEDHRTYQYLNKDVFTDSCAGILFGGKFHFGFGTEHGWKPLGRMRRVSSSYGNVIRQIDDLPAVKLYENYFAKNMLDLSKELRRISIFYPLGIYLPGEKEYLLRNVISIKDDGSLVTQGDIPENSKVRLMISTEDSRLRATIAACEEAKKNSPVAKIKFLLVFASAARFTIMRRQLDTELCVIKEIFGEKTPLIGIYTNGEQAPLKSIDYLGRTYFHNQSINILAIGEQ